MCASGSCREVGLRIVHGAIFQVAALIPRRSERKKFSLAKNFFVVQRGTMRTCIRECRPSAGSWHRANDRPPSSPMRGVALGCQRVLPRRSRLARPDGSTEALEHVRRRARGSVNRSQLAPLSQARGAVVLFRCVSRLGRRVAIRPGKRARLATQRKPFAGNGLRLPPPRRPGLVVVTLPPSKPRPNNSNRALDRRDHWVGNTPPSHRCRTNTIAVHARYRRGIPSGSRRQKDDHEEARIGIAGDRYSTSTTRPHRASLHGLFGDARCFRHALDDMVARGVG